MREYRIQCEKDLVPTGQQPSGSAHPPTPLTSPRHDCQRACPLTCATEPPTTLSLQLLPDRIRWNWPQNKRCGEKCVYGDQEPDSDGVSGRLGAGSSPPSWVT